MNMNASDFNFFAARKNEEYVFGAKRPGHEYFDELVPKSEVDNWISFMQKQKIKGVCCLLDSKHLDLYKPDLIRKYRQKLGKENVLHVPVVDGQPCTKKQLRERIIPFLQSFADRKEKVVVHCSAGLGRTGIVLAAWLAAGRGYSPKEAVEEVLKHGRNPLEAVWNGSLTKEELYDLITPDPRRYVDSRKSLRKLKLNLRFMRAQADDVCRKLDLLIESTRSCPIRKKSFKLDRESEALPAHCEARLERAIWNKWRKQGDFITDVCERIISYQMPLALKKKDGCRLAIDLIGIHSSTPVVIELKAANANESPLRILCEAAAYAITVRKLWACAPNCEFRAEWEARTLTKANRNKLENVPIVCMAPNDYWKKRRGDYGAKGRASKDAWLAFFGLIDAFTERGFPATLVGFDEGPEDKKGLPEISGIQVITREYLLNEFDD